MNKKLTLFKSPDINREVKLHIFLCMGDIALGCKEAILPYLDDIKKIFDIAFAAAIEISVFFYKFKFFLNLLIFFYIFIEHPLIRKTMIL